jgi:hypothetical protein
VADCVGLNNLKFDFTAVEIIPKRFFELNVGATSEENQVKYYERK